MQHHNHQKICRNDSVRHHIEVHIVSSMIHSNKNRRVDLCSTLCLDDDIYVVLYITYAMSSKLWLKMVEMIFL